MKNLFNQYSVVTVPFPFTDRSKSKKRPALVLSNSAEFDQKVGASVLAMITSAKNSPWPFDYAISNLKSAGLPVASLVRMKFFTIDHRLIIGKIGELSKQDQKNLKAVLADLFCI